MTKAKAPVKLGTISVYMIQTDIPNTTSQTFPQTVFLGQVDPANVEVPGKWLLMNSALVLQDLLYFRLAEDGRLKQVTQAELQNEALRDVIKIVPRLFLSEALIACSATVDEALSKAARIPYDRIVSVLEVTEGSTYYEAYTGSMGALSDTTNPVRAKMNANMAPDLRAATEGLYNPNKFDAVFDVPGGNPS